jgi:hypothetical protein
VLTQKIEDGPLLLLETIPGLRFRSRKKHHDETSALNYFRNLVDAHANSSLDSAVIRDIIGLEASYSPLFEHSLRLIPEAQLHDISWDKLGEGANGAVYSAVWQKPAGHLAAARAEEREVDVVLKDVLPRSGTSQDPRKKLVKEVCIHLDFGAVLLIFQSWT